MLATALVWGSFLLAHQVAYFLAFSSAADRAHELSHSGHGWLASAIHFGVPAIFAVLIIGLAIRHQESDTSSTRARYFGGATAALFVTVEILERLLSAAGPQGHGFAINWTVMASGVAVAFIFGSLTSALYFRFQELTVRAIAKCIQPHLLSSHRQFFNTNDFLSTKAILPSFILKHSRYRGPPLLV